MKDHQRQNSSFSAFLETDFYKIFLALSSFVALASSFGALNVPTWVTAALLAVIAIALGVAGFNFYKSRHYKVLPRPSGKFDPFPKQEDWTPWPRIETTSEIASLVSKQFDKHILVVSPSGTGKSTMVRQLLPKRFPQHQCIEVEDYEDIVERMVFRLGALAKEDEQRTEIDDLLREINNERIPIEVLVRRIEVTISAIIEKQKLIFCFDQIERYFVAAEAKSFENYDAFVRERLIIRAILRALRLNPSVFTVFAIRSEYVYGSLVSLFNVNMNGSDLEEYVEFYFLWGVNSDTDRADYLQLAESIAADYGGTDTAKRIFEIAKIDNPIHANSFIFNLAGYLFEISESRQSVKARLEKTRILSEDDLIDIYLDTAFEGFLQQDPSKTRNLFDTILYALGSENRLSGLACSMQRLAGLAHFPIDEAQEVVSYLVGIGIVQPSKHNGDFYYRMRHDKISDHLLKSDHLDIHSRAIDGIRFLTENRVHTDHLTVPEHYPKALETSSKHFLKMSYLAVVIFAVFGLFRILFPEQVYAIYGNFYDYLNKYFDIYIPKYYFSGAYYMPHFMAHLAWVSYIDRMNRAFIQYTGGKRLKIFGAMLAPFGTIMGILGAFLPQYFVIPVVAVGVVFGTMLLIGSHGAGISGGMSAVMNKWGVRTLGNMGIVALSAALFIPLFDGSENMLLNHYVGESSIETVRLIGIFIAAVFLLWFWHHIRDEQNNPRIWSANLALYDKGRSDE